MKRKPSETVRRTPEQLRLRVMSQSRLQHKIILWLAKASVVSNPRVAGSIPARPNSKAFVLLVFAPCLII